MVAAELSPTFTAVSLSPAYLTEGTAKAQTQIKLYAFMRVMKVLSRPYRICDSPLTTGRSRLCRPTRRTKSSAQPSSARERPLTASKSEPIAPKSSAKAPTNLDHVEATPIDIPTSLWYHRLGPVTSFFRWFHRTQEN